MSNEPQFQTIGLVKELPVFSVNSKGGTYVRFMIRPIVAPAIESVDTSEIMVYYDGTAMLPLIRQLQVGDAIGVTKGMMTIMRKKVTVKAPVMHPETYKDVLCAVPEEIVRLGKDGSIL